MPITRIYEEDLSTANINTGVDCVAVFGYAVKGPINTPTQCDTPADFKRIFGDYPYVFKSAKSLPGQSTIYYNAGDYEKSYIYALELLNAGLRVLFTRTCSESTMSYATTKIPLSTKSYYGTLQCSVISIKSSFEKETNEDGLNKYVLTHNGLGHDIWGVKAGTLTISFYNNVGEAINITPLNGGYSISGLTDGSIFEFDGVACILYTSADLGNIISNVSVQWSVKVGHTWKISNGINGYSVQYFTSTTQSTSPASIITLESKGSDHNDTFSCVFESGFTGTIVTSQYESAQNLSYLKVVSKYPGEYYGALQGSIQHIGVGIDQIDLFKIIISGNDYEEYIISFVNTSTYYFGTTDFKSINLSLERVGSDGALDLNSGFVIPTFTSKIGNTLVNNYYQFKKTDGSNGFSYEATQTDEFSIISYYSMIFGSDFSDGLLEIVSDSSLYDIQFISLGGYPCFGLPGGNYSQQLLTAAATRTSCVALIDPISTYTALDLYTHVNSATGIMKELINGEDTRKYGAMFFPSADYLIGTVVYNFPGSFAYLKCLGGARTNSWQAIAGAQRGIVSGIIKPNVIINKLTREKLQSSTGISINPIVLNAPYGYEIYGNRTLLNNVIGLTKSSFLNIRRLCNEIKNVIYPATEYLRFELDTPKLWDTFKSLICPTLDAMRTGGGIQGYNIERLPQKQKGEFNCKITISPVEAIEDFNITLSLTDTTIAVNE